MLHRIFYICSTAALGILVGLFMTDVYVRNVHGYDHGYGETEWAAVVLVPLCALISIVIGQLLYEGHSAPR